MSNHESTEDLQTWLIRWVAAELSLHPDEIDPAQTLLNYGFDSVQAMTLVGDIESRLGMRLPPTLVWDHPSIHALVSHLATLAPAASRAGGSEQTPASGRLPHDLADRLDTLSDEDVDTLLRRFLESQH